MSIMVNLASCLHRCTWYLIFTDLIHFFFHSCLEVCFMHHDCVYSTTSVHIISGVCTCTNMNHSKKMWLSHFENFNWMLVFKAHHWLCCVESHPNSASSKIPILTTLPGYQIWFVSCAIEQNNKTTITVLYWLREVYDYPLPSKKVSLICTKMESL